MQIFCGSRGGHLAKGAEVVGAQEMSLSQRSGGAEGAGGGITALAADRVAHGTEASSLRPAGIR